MRSAGLTDEAIRVRCDFWFALANRIFGYDMTDTPHGPRIVTLRERIAYACYNRAVEWQERIEARRVKYSPEPEWPHGRHCTIPDCPHCGGAHWHARMPDA